MKLTHWWSHFDDSRPITCVSTDKEIPIVGEITKFVKVFDFVDIYAG
jgi:hypothetical protein